MPPVIDKQICRKCGRCADACPSDVFFGSRKNGVPSITYPEECWHCNACVEVCPHEGSIRLRTALPLTIMYKNKTES